MIENALFINRSQKIGDIVHGWLIKQCDIFTSTDRCFISNIVIIVTDDNQEIDETDFGPLPLVVFTTDLGKLPPSSKKMIIFRLIPFETVCEKALIKKATFREGVPFCVLREWLKDIKVTDILKFEGKITISTGKIASKKVMSEYFGWNLKYLPTPVFEDESHISKRCAEVWGRKKIVILIPTYHRVEKLMMCFDSIAKAVLLKNKEGKNPQHKNENIGFQYTRNWYRICLGDNGTTYSETGEGKKMKEWYKNCKHFKTLLSDEYIDTDEIKIYLSEKNLGKAKMVNHLYKMSKEDGFNPDYVFSVDSDMIYQPDKFLFAENKFDKMIHILERCHNIGMVSSHQHGECHHWFGRGVIEKREMGYALGESVTGVGVSGGCVVLRSSDWEEIGGYREDYDVYAADDAILMDKVQKKLGKRVVVAIDCPFTHPPPDEDEKGYKEWKMKRFAERGLENGKAPVKKPGKMDKGYYD